MIRGRNRYGAVEEEENSQSGGWNFYSGAELLFFDGGFLHGSDVHNGDGEASVPVRDF